MSALLRSSRSRSKTAPDSTTSAALNKGQISGNPSGSPVASPTSIQNSGLRRSLTPESVAAAPPPSQTVLDIIPSDTVSVDIGSVNETKSGTKEPLDEEGDSRSSSLSELGDGSMDAEEPQAHTRALLDREDNDSEAETERLENTPRNLVRRIVNNVSLVESTPVSSPTKRGVPSVSEDDPSTANSPTDTSDDQLDDGDVNGGSHSLLDPKSNITAADATGTETEAVGKKRKRPSSDTSSTVGPDEEGPAKKRIETSRFDAEEDGEKAQDTNLDDADDETNEYAAEDAPLGHVDETAEDLDAAVDAPGELVEDATEDTALHIRSSKSKKGKRKGKKVIDTIERPNGMRASPDPHEPDERVEDEADEEDTAYIEEQNANKKVAMEQLGMIEQKFKIFRERLCDENLSECSKSLNMLHGTNVVHPDFLKMVDCLDERRDEKVALERKAFQYKMGCLRNKILAERHQLQSQYLQTVRDKREIILDDCNKHLAQLNKERRRFGAEEMPMEYNLYFPAKASEQRRQLSAYNLEVSILAGVAKYVGFPAAPEVASARDSDIEDDLRAMKINTRPQTITRPLLEPSRADRVAAEEQFLEQTPWANPQHPAHSNFHPLTAVAQAQPATNSISTPATQRRAIDIYASNGSASTIERIADTPSSAIGPGSATFEQQQQRSRHDLDSPVAQIKHAQVNSDSVKETSATLNASQAVRPGPFFSKESRSDIPFAGLSSVPTRPQEPLPEPEIADANHAQMSQRSAVSVGGGGGAAGLYGR